MNNQTIEQSCRSACESIGVNYKSVPADGQFYTADLSNDSKGKNDGRIKIFSDYQGGIVFNNKSGEQQSFFINRKAGEPIPPIDHEHIQREQQRRKTEQLAIYDKAACKALALWKSAQSASDNHPYLLNKQVKAHGLRLAPWSRSFKDDEGNYQQIIIDNCLILPLYNSDGELRSLQAIFPEHNPTLDRNKDFMPRGAMAGLFWWLGAKTNTVLIAEGFATAASLYEQTGYRVYMAMTANNLLAVGRIVREKLPTHDIIFCADNDTKTPVNAGVTKSTEAALVVDGSVVAPPISGDFNDYVNYLREVRP
jgi:putative DNA primase/helicase